MSRRNIHRLVHQKASSSDESHGKIKRSSMAALHAVEELIERYKPEDYPISYYKKQLKHALKFVKEKTTFVDFIGSGDYFADPLRVVEELIKGKADWDTILAAVLYRAARPMKEGRGFSQANLDEIQKDFGDKVLRLIKQTHYFRSLNLPAAAMEIEQNKNLNPDKKEKIMENIRLHRLMSMWAAGDPRVIKIATRELSIALQEEYDRHGALDPQVLERLLMNAEHVYSDLNYIAGYGQDRKKLRNLCYKLKDPVGLHQVHKRIGELVDLDDADEIKKVVTSYIEDKFNWREGTHFDVEFRPKDASEAYSKMRRQGKNLEDLPDLYGFRVLLKLPAIGIDDKTIADLTPDEREEALREFGIKILDVGNRLSKLYGRASKKHTHSRKNAETGETEYYSYIQERIKQFANDEPRSLDKVLMQDKKRAERERIMYPEVNDCRFEDGITFPKASGFSLLKDTFFFFLRNKERPIEAEFHILCELRHDFNTFGPRAGHFYYKADMREHSDSILDWFSAVRTITTGRGITHIPTSGLATNDDDKTPRKRIYVTDDKGNGYNVSTVREFIVAAGLVGKCDEVSLTTVFGQCDPGKTYGPSTVLMNGMSVKPIKKLEP